MKIITVAGPPCAGKTSIINYLVRRLIYGGMKAAAAELDAADGGTIRLYEKPSGILSRHKRCFGAPDFRDVIGWGKHEKADVLFIESGAFCFRWVPFAGVIPVLGVIDNLCSPDFPCKMECLLKIADAVAVTKTDLVAGAETDMLKFKIRHINPDAPIVEFSGLNGKGGLKLERMVELFKNTGEISDTQPFFPAPESFCRHCTAETDQKRSLSAHAEVFPVDFPRISA